MTDRFLIGWRQVASVFVLLASVAVITSGYSVMVVPLEQEFHVGRMVLMLAMTVVSVVSALLAPLLGGMMDRISLRSMMLLGAVLLGAGFTAVSFATSFTHVLIVFGALIAPANVLLGPVAATVLLSRWFVKRRGTAIGVALAGISMGGVVFPPLVQWLLDSYEWRVALRLFAAILCAIIIPAAALVVSSPAEKNLHPDGAASDPEAARAGEAPAQVSVRSILTEPAFWLIGLLFAIVLSGMKGVVSNLVPLAVDQGIEHKDAALLISVFSGGGLVSKVVFAAAADKVGPRVLTILGFGGFAAGMACLSQASHGYPVIALGVAMIGLFGGFMVPLKSLLIPRIFGRGAVGRAMGLMSTLGLCASFATPPIFGLMYDLTGSYATISLIFAGLASAAILVAPSIRMDPLPAAPGKSEGAQAAA